MCADGAVYTDGAVYMGVQMPKEFRRRHQIPRVTQHGCGEVNSDLCNRCRCVDSPAPLGIPLKAFLVAYMRNMFTSML